MSRKTIPGLPGGVPLIGGGKPPEPVNIVIPDDQGNSQIFPVVALHLLTPAAQQQLGQLICSAVEAVLVHHGLIKPPPDAQPQAQPIPEGTAVA